jgi:hypothetical protein
MDKSKNLTPAEEQLLQDLEEAYQHELHVVQDGERSALPPKGRYVYLLSCNGKLVVAGHGDKNRARVVLDAAGGRATVGHVKGLFVRLVRKYRPDHQFLGLWMGPMSPEEAKRVEKDVHKRFGGNSLSLPEDVKLALETELKAVSESGALLVRLATLSFYSGLSDLRRWTQAGLVRHEDAVAIDNLLGGAICLPAAKAPGKASKRRTPVASTESSASVATS